MTPDWLQTYLVEAVQKNLCTKIYCTTCGAIEFRSGVMTAFARAPGAHSPIGMNERHALAIARALQGVQPADATDPKLIDAARCLLFDICGTIGEAEPATVLGDSWGGTMLRHMQEHHRARQAAQHARTESEANAPSRREAKKRLKQEEHAKRLALKRERDRLRREQHGKTDSEGRS